MSVTLEERNAALDRAKALILQGWTQGAMQEDNCYCALGALIKSSTTTDLEHFCWIACSSALIKLGYSYSIIEYNDADRRTKYEVAALFDHAKEQPL